MRSPGIKARSKRTQPNPLPKIRMMGGDNESPMTSPNFKSSPVSGPNTPSITSITTPILSNSPPDLEEIKVPVILPTTPTTLYNPCVTNWVHAGGGRVNPHSMVHVPPLPPRPKRVERRVDSSPPPPPLPPRQPPLPPRSTPTRGILESRSPHMDPVEPRREPHLFTHYATHSPPPALAPRRHSSNIVNGNPMGKPLLLE